MSESRKKSGSKAGPDTMFNQFAENMGKIDKEKMTETYQQNVETCSEVLNLLADVYSRVSEMQSEFATKSLRTLGTSATEFAKEPSSMDKMQQHAENVRQVFSDAFSHQKDLAEHVIKSNTAIYDMIQERMKDNMQSMKKAFKKENVH